MASGLSVNFKILGASEIEATFNGLIAADQKGIFRKALRESMKPVLKELKGKLPKKSKKRGTTGRLRKYTKLRAAKRSRKGIALVIRLPLRTELDIPQDAKGYYPGVLEYGSKKRRIKPRKFLRSTFKKNKSKILKTLGRRMAHWLAWGIKTGYLQKRAA